MTASNPFIVAGYTDVLAVDPVLCLNCAESNPACNWYLSKEFSYVEGYSLDVKCPCCGYSYAKIAQIKKEWGFDRSEAV